MIESRQESEHTGWLGAVVLGFFRALLPAGAELVVIPCACAAFVSDGVQAMGLVQEVLLQALMTYSSFFFLHPVFAILL